jgi:Pyruvate/2-oxoacid:ferredoxin oxidoreductase delta subunit
MTRRTSRRWPRPSTREFWSEGRRQAGYSLFDALHGYVYARFPYLYISIATGEHWMSRAFKPMTAQIGRFVERRVGANGNGREGAAFADTYHGKVVPLPAARQLVSIREDVTLRDLEHVIPYKLARDIVLKNPDHIVALECPCRAARPDPCQPLDVCLIVGEPFASFVMEHHPRRARWISQAEAGEILEAEQARGHVSHAFFKDAMLGRFYAICNCCACCCGAMQAHRAGTPMLASSGYVTRADESACTGCGTCVQFCQFGALALVGGHIAVDSEACMGCGVCASKCTQGALALVREPGRGIPLEIHELISQPAADSKP